MQQRQQLPSRSRMRRHSGTRSELPLGTLTTAVVVLAVLVLLGATFVGEWARLPAFELSTSTPLLSPNGDRDHDLAVVTYQLAEEARITARVLNEGGGVVRLLLSDQAQPAGQYSLTWDGTNEFGAVSDDGRYRLELTVGGVLRSSSRSVILDVDTRPPTLQLANLEDGARVGEPVLTVQGVTEPGAVLWVNDEAQPLTADNQGRFAFQRKLVEGSNLVEVRAVDEAGNSARVQRQVLLVTRPPDVAITQPPEGLWTNQPVLALQGQAPPGATVTVNDQPVTVDEDGNFRYEILLNEGQNLLRVAAVDDVGNLTTLERSVYLKTAPPELRLNVTEGATFSDALLQIVGHTDPGVSVQINGRVVPVSSLGDFQSSLFLTTGDNLIQVEGRDQAGNLTTLTRRVQLSGPSSASVLERLWRNLSGMPSLLLPALIIVGLFFALIFLRQNQVSLALSVDRNTFTPGLPGENKALELLLDLDRPARVSLEVLDGAGGVQATLLHDRRRSARAHVFRWDGYDDYGMPVPPGDYIVQATAGSPPLKVTSAVQVTILEDVFVHRQLDDRAILRNRRSPGA